MSNPTLRTFSGAVTAAGFMWFASVSAGVDVRFPIDLSLAASTAPNGDVALQWASTPKAWAKVAGDSASFSRGSAGYTTDDHQLRVWKPNEPAMTTIASCNSSLGRMHLEPGPDGTPLTPVCVANGKLFAVSRNGRLFKTTDGVNWTLTTHLMGTGTYVGLRSGTLLALTREDDRVSVFRSTDEGSVWIRANDANTQTPFRWITPGAWLAPFGVHQADDGVIVMVEYQLPEGGRYIYRSDDDGASWRVVHDAATQHPMHHFHAVAKQKALNRWVTCTGDTLLRQRIIISDDNALTWHDLTYPGEAPTQPTYFLDYDHPTRLLIGSDTAEQVGWIDVSDGPDRGQVQSLITNWDARPARGYCFSMWKHDGVFYAASYNGSAGASNSVISASRDLEHWSVYHRFTQGEIGAVSYAGYFNGAMQIGALLQNRVQHLVLPPADLSLRPAMQVSSGASNLAPPALASCDSVAGWINLSPATAGGSNTSVLQTVSSPVFEGAAAIRAERGDGGRLVVRTPAIPVAPLQTVQARLMIRGQGAHFAIRWCVNSVEAGDFALYYLPRDTWQEVVTAPLTLPAGAADVRLQFLLESSTANRCELLLDGVMVELGTSTHFHPPGAARDADRYLFDLGDGDGEWTHVFALQPIVARDHLAAGAVPRIIRAYRASNPATTGDDELQALDLNYGANDGFVVAHATTMGGAKQTAYLQAQHFNAGAQLRLAVRAGGERLSISLANGGPFSTATLSGAEWPAGGVTASINDGSALQQLPGRLFDDMVYHWKLTDAELEEVSQLPDLPRSLEIEQIAIERSANGGPFEEIWRGPADLSGFTDPAQAGVNRRVYRARAWRGEEKTALSAMIMADGALPADFNADGLVNLADAAELQQALGSCTSIQDPPAICDMNQDRCVDAEDWVAWASYVAE